MLKSMLKPKELKEVEKYNQAKLKLDMATAALEARNNEVMAARAKVQDEGPEAQGELDIAKKSRDSAQSILNDLKEDFEVAASRYQYALQEKERIDIQTAWNETGSMAEDLKKASIKLEDKIASIVEDFNKLQDLGVQAHHRAPKTDSPLHSSLLSNEHLTTALRLHLVKAGFSWASNWPYTAHEIMPFSQRVNDACNWVMKLKGLE